MAFERFWHKSYVPGVPYEADIEKITMAEVLERNAKRFPSVNTLNFMGKKITYREFNSLVNRFANALIGLGVKKGDMVAMLLPNIPQMVIANYATYKIGGVTVMNNPLYTERELEYQLNDSDSTTLITLDLLLPRALSLKGKTKIERIITCHINDFLPFPAKQLFPFVKKDMFRKVEPQAGVYEFTELIKQYPDSTVKIQAEWDGLAALVYTGGTTGVSKGVMLTHANCSSNVQQLRYWIHDLEDGKDSLLYIFPVFHTAGYLCQNFCVWTGLTNVLIPRPEPKALADMISKYKPTYIGGVPTIYVGMLKEPKFKNQDVTFIKGFFSGAAPLPVEIIRQLKDATGSTILEIYGQTETSPVATVTPWGGKIKVGTVGLPVCNTDIRIVGEDGKDMSIGESGEICFRGPQVMKGYYKKPKETAETIVDGWLHTGDVGVMDEEGYLSIVDRMKDMIIAGGYNIYPAEIDDVLYKHPKVFEACTIGVPHEYRGETVKCYIVLKPGETADAEEIIRHCKDNLGAYKVPKDIEFIDELPKSAVGKILRREVRDLDKKRKGASAA
ncbi:MAG: long-chain fatty acid--CoA ligase [Deltaproteobacteria bacterium]|nr:long-chain fatty acid--CoA ligase [Deltaproteobacteria bacterium]